MTVKAVMCFDSWEHRYTTITTIAHNFDEAQKVMQCFVICKWEINDTQKLLQQQMLSICVVMCLELLLTLAENY